MKNVLTLGLVLAVSTSVSISISAFAAEPLAQLIVQPSSLGSEMATEIGERIIESCKAISTIDTVKVVNVTGRPGYADFGVTLMRSSLVQPQKSDEKIEIKVEQELDVPFSRNYTIGCDKRSTPLRDQRLVKTNPIRYSIGGDLRAKLVSAKVEEAIQSNVSTDGSVRFANPDALIVGYTMPGSEKIVQYYAVARKEMSAAFAKAVFSGQPLQVSKLVSVVVKRVATSAQTHKCVGYGQVYVGPNGPDDQGGIQIQCIKQGLVTIHGKADTLSFKPQF